MDVDGVRFGGFFKLIYLVGIGNGESGQQHY